MDNTQQIEAAKQELLSLGFTEEKYNKLIELALEEMVDNALNELQEIDLEGLEKLESQLIPEVKSLEEAEKNLELIFSAAYKEKANETKQQMLLDYLFMTIEETKAAKDLLQRYQAGDPTAIAAIEAQKDNPEIEELMEVLKEEGITSTDDASSQSPQQTSL